MVRRESIVDPANGSLAGVELLAPPGESVDEGQRYADLLEAWVATGGRLEREWALSPWHRRYGVSLNLDTIEIVEDGKWNQLTSAAAKIRRGRAAGPSPLTIEWTERLMGGWARGETRQKGQWRAIGQAAQRLADLVQSGRVRYVAIDDYFSQSICVPGHVRLAHLCAAGVAMDRIVLKFSFQNRDGVNRHLLEQMRNLGSAHAGPTVVEGAGQWEDARRMGTWVQVWGAEIQEGWQAGSGSAGFGGAGSSHPADDAEEVDGEPGQVKRPERAVAAGVRDPAPRKRRQGE